MVEGTALRDGDASRGFYPAAHEHIDELGAEVGLAGLEHLLPQHHLAAAHTHHVAVKETDVLGFVALSDHGKEVEVGADAATTQAFGALAGHLHLGQVGKWGDALSGADRVEDGGEHAPEGGQATSVRSGAGAAGELAEAGAGHVHRTARLQLLAFH